MLSPNLCSKTTRSGVPKSQPGGNPPGVFDVAPGVALGNRCGFSPPRTSPYCRYPGNRRAPSTSRLFRPIQSLKLPGALDV